MRNGTVVADLTDPSAVYGVHGSEGLSWWKCLARRPGLYGPWEAVEWARVPPGGVSGEHLHTRTEEIYAVLRGRGEIRLNGEAHAVGPGDLVLTAAGGRHGLANRGESDLDWLVVELTVDEPVFDRSGGEARMAAETATRGAAQIRSLRGPGSIDPRDVLSGPVSEIARRHLEPSGELSVGGPGHEATVFTLAGGGTALSAGARIPLSAGTAVTLPLGARLTVTAGGDGLQLLIVRLEVAQR